MKLVTPIRWLVATNAIATITNAQTSLEEAILTDILEAYSTHVPSTCTSPESASATSFSFDWPGANPNSDWYGPFQPFEEGNFNAIMSHTDVNDRSWSIRIGSSGNMYSHYTPDMWGETIPPQKHSESPWIDEVQQSVSVNDLNGHSTYGGKAYFIHQAGAYQRDGSYTDVPFFSPSLAKFCSGNSCMFASWGAQAHVPTPFTSPVIYINKYTNCDNGIIEHTQMIHNFADPVNALSTPLNVDQTYFNVGWGGVRSSSLPYALEPDPSTGNLPYTDPNNVRNLPLCRWGDDEPGGLQGIGARKELKYLGGYTAFADSRLLLNETLPPIQPWCRNNNDPTCSSASTCMVSSCSDAEVAAGTHTRIQLKVPTNNYPRCVFHTWWNGLVSLACNLRDTTGFGQTTPYVTGGAECAPWTNIGFYRPDGEHMNIAYIRHWSWSPSNKRVYFAVFSTDKTQAINMVDNFFDNRGNGSPMTIDVRPTSNVPQLPPGYDPSTFDAFTYVYGDGLEYGSSLEGKARRRIGATEQGVGTRDYTVFTVNWYGGSRLQPGYTYVNRGFYMNTNLGSVKTTAEDLVTKTFADEVGLELWSPRTVNIYKYESAFVTKAAATPQGSTTTCLSSATLACSGKSTPKSGYIPYFYVTCGASHYFGSDPYHFTPSFNGQFPGHGSTSNIVRAYLCDGQATSVRPTFKLMGFFNPTECTGMENDIYSEIVCDADYEPPTASPTAGPTVSSTPAPSVTTSPSGSISPTDKPTLPQVNLALEAGAVASQSSTCHGGVASRAIDGNTDGSWANGSVQHTCETDNPSSWWMVDLGAEKQHMITSVSMYARTDCCGDRVANSDVQILDNSGNIVTSQTIAGNDIRSLYNFDFGNIQGRYVRIQKNSSGPLNFAEAEIMGVSSPITASPTTDAPTIKPTVAPTHAPTPAPSSNPTPAPTHNPTPAPSSNPTNQPVSTNPPTLPPTMAPTDSPVTPNPTPGPTKEPSEPPTPVPSPGPTPLPTSQEPTNFPTNPPTLPPSDQPTPEPSPGPTSPPVTKSPTNQPTNVPSPGPTEAPVTKSPTSQPSHFPTNVPTAPPSNEPTPLPSGPPTNLPTGFPTSPPTPQPTFPPSVAPTNNPTPKPTSSPTSLSKDGWCSDNTGRCNLSDLSECACNNSSRRLIKGTEELRLAAKTSGRKLARKTSAPTSATTPGPTNKPTQGPTPAAPVCSCLGTAFPTPMPTTTKPPTPPPSPPTNEPPVDCTAYNDKNQCAAAGCSWSGKNKNCIALASPPPPTPPPSPPTNEPPTPPPSPPTNEPPVDCTAYNDKNQCAAAGCSWSGKNKNCS